MSLARIIETTIPGCYEILPTILRDERGTFVKTFHQGLFLENHFEISFYEEYYSASHKGVLRGMHFQVPPMDQVKMVYCVSGRVFDAVVDLRVGSPTYGRHAVFELTADKANMVYIPRGLAHGFYVLSDTAIMLYKVTSVYSPQHDAGILWNSVGIPWPTNDPVISKRDSEFPGMEDFKSPFAYIDAP